MATLILHEAVRMKKLIIGIAQLSMRSSLGDAACWQVPWIARITLDACLTVSIITHHCYAIYFPSCNTQQSSGFGWGGTFNILTLALICPSGPTTCRTSSKQNTWPHFSAWGFWSHALPAVFHPNFAYGKSWWVTPHTAPVEFAGFIWQYRYSIGWWMSLQWCKDGYKSEQTASSAGGEDSTVGESLDLQSQVRASVPAGYFLVCALSKPITSRS